MPLLRNGQITLDARLDRIYELDWRSLNYPISRQIQDMPTYRPRSYTWSIETWLDQGVDGACVGFSFAHELIARPAEVTGINGNYAKYNIYHEAQKIDPWQGGSYDGAQPFYEGTSTLAGVQVCQRLGFYESYHWALTTEELARGVAYFGPCVIGVNWYEGMFEPDPEGFLRPFGYLAGGHAILVHAVKIYYKNWMSWGGRTWRDVDWDKSYVVVHNSWGRGWGDNGRAKISFRDMDRLLAESGEAVFPKRTKLLAA